MDMMNKPYFISGSCICSPPKHNGHRRRKYSLGLGGRDACSSCNISSVDRGWTLKGGDDEPDGDIDTGVDGVDDAGGNGDANTEAFEEERPESICESNSFS